MAVSGLEDDIMVLVLNDEFINTLYTHAPAPSQILLILSHVYCLMLDFKRAKNCRLIDRDLKVKWYKQCHLEI